MVWISFDHFESLSNGSNLHLNASNAFWMVRICIRMLRIAFEWLEFVHKFFGWLSMVRFSFRMHRILSNALNLDSKLESNSSNPSRVQIWIRILWLLFKLHSNASNLIWSVWIWIRMLWIPFKGLEFAFEHFEILSNSLNLHSNTSNLFQMLRICIWTLQNPFEWIKFALKTSNLFWNVSNLHSNASNSF